MGKIIRKGIEYSGGSAGGGGGASSWQDLENKPFETLSDDFKVEDGELKIDGDFGSKVEVSADYTTGTKVATITIDGVATEVKVPASVDTTAMHFKGYVGDGIINDLPQTRNEGDMYVAYKEGDYNTYPDMVSTTGVIGNAVNVRSYITPSFYAYVENANFLGDYYPIVLTPNSTYKYLVYFVKVGSGFNDTTTTKIRASFYSKSATTANFKILKTAGGVNFYYHGGSVATINGTDATIGKQFYAEYTKAVYNTLEEGLTQLAHDLQTPSKIHLKEGEAVICHNNNWVKVGADGSDVSYTSELTEGTKIGTLTINDTPQDIYAPEAEDEIIEITKADYDTLTAEQKKDKTFCITDWTPGTTTGGVYNGPLGEIIAFMGTIAPDNFLICDGSIYNIADYLDLANHINKNFGSFNFFGGDGETTFAVPDLRGEFLRGTGTNGHADSGNGSNVGVHQDGTQIPQFQYYRSDTTSNNFLFAMDLSPTGTNYIKNQDVELKNSTGRIYKDVQYTAAKNDSDINVTYARTVRPTNTSVLYCIRYREAGSGNTSSAWKKIDTVIGKTEITLPDKYSELYFEVRTGLNVFTNTIIKERIGDYIKFYVGAYYYDNNDYVMTNLDLYPDKVSIRNIRNSMSADISESAEFTVYYK